MNTPRKNNKLKNQSQTKISIIYAKNIQKPLAKEK